MRRKPRSAGPTAFASGQSGPQAIALAASRVYWTNHDAGEVMVCGVSGCNSAPTVFASNEAAPTGIAVDAVNVYFTAYGTGNGDGRVVVLPQQGP